MVKFRLYFDKDAETEWLNQMAAEGWAMKSFFAGFYTFEKCKKGEFIYQVDFGDKLFKISDEYREYMQEMGIEVVQTWGYWIILRKPAFEGAFELYTDAESAIEHYSKIKNMFKGVLTVAVICLIMELAAGAGGFAAGFIFAVIIGAMAISLLNNIRKIDQIIEKLK